MIFQLRPQIVDWLTISYDSHQIPSTSQYTGITVHGIYTLWLFNIAMEHGLSIDGLPIKNGGFPWQTVSHNQMVYIYIYIWYLPDPSGNLA